MTRFTNFADMARHFSDSDNRDSGYDTAFDGQNEMAKLSIVDAPQALDMPDPQMVRCAVEMMMGTLFDVFRDTRMESYAADLAWGFVNSFHVVARRIEGREDDAAKDLGELARCFDPSEIYATELEDKQLLAQTLFDARQAMECMRDHAADVFRVETGRPFSATKGSRTSSSLTASQIEARDFLAARARTCREAYAPEGPVVAFSGGNVWHDHELLWNRLDSIKTRVPEMVLATTAQVKGCDAIAAAWAAARGVKLVQFRLDRAHGNRAGFVRNDKIVGLRPVEAIVCEGSGLQANFAQKLRQAGTPLHIIRASDQVRDLGRQQAA
ncbi:DUF2493 domain-containing protein [Sphingomonas sp. SUN039]|uniref:DUF2493 domain-containing protein n=1 Tax=Sphingomonas sp. SUN039 TaxID=2937787 RepID=UPI002164590C|nr:DUF2493 domain-containing protein [Sphingomonas sp. SUN039]UVO53725.1 DUF2493 domain-containing protein [Sphingomonas sp. SUN039]